MAREAIIWRVNGPKGTIDNIHSETEAHRIAKRDGGKVSSYRVTLDSKGRYRHPGSYGRP